MAQKRPPSNLSVAPTIDAAKAIPLLKRQVERLDELLKANTRFDDPAADGWKSSTENILTAVYGKPNGDFHRNTQDFLYAQGGPQYVNMPDHEIQANFTNKQKKRRALLVSFIEGLEDLAPSSSVQGNAGSATAAAALARVQRTLSRFHQAARQLRNRYDGRPTLEIEDEYDVQDLLHAFLKLDFDDIRAEEYTPSYAGKCTRMDFLLKNEQTVVECKRTRKGLAEKELGSELIEDIGRYRSHPECKTLVCFVYDPEGRIGNPAGLRSDLEKLSSDDLKVRVVICPT